MTCSGPNSTPQGRFVALIRGQTQSPTIATTLRKFVSEGADPSPTYTYTGAGGGCNATELAVKAGNTQAIRFLHEIGIDLTVGTSPEFATPLHMAVALSSKAALTLIELGAIKSGQGKVTLLHNASLLGRTELIQPLVMAGLDVEARSPLGKTPLLLARDEAVLGALLGAGANIDAADAEGRRLIHHAADLTKGAAGVARKILLVRALIGYGADLETPSKAGNVPREMIANDPQLSSLHIFKSYMARRAALEALEAISPTGESLRTPELGHD